MSRRDIDPEQARRAADGELAEGESVPASAADAVAFERELRSRVADAMREAPRPGDLRTSVLLHVVSRLEEERKERRARRAPPGRRHTLMRAAALLCVLLAGVGIGRFTRVVSVYEPPMVYSEDVEESGLGGGLGGGLDDLLRERFFDGEEDTPLSYRHLLGECENALAATTAWLGSLPLLACNLEQGVRLVGIGPIPHPGPGRGSLMVYEVEIGWEVERVTVFVEAPTEAPRKREEGRVVSLDAGPRHVLWWVQDGLVYHAVAESFEAAERVVAAMGLGPAISKVPEIPVAGVPK